MQPVVALDEIFTRTRKLRLDLAFDTSIFDDIEVALERMTDSLGLVISSDLV
jgi:hypothetical protein